MKENKHAKNREDAATHAAPEHDPQSAADPKDQTCFERDEMREAMEALDDKNRELDELNNRLLRLQADFDNFRRRARLEKEELSQTIAFGVIKELLPVLDNFERALAAPASDAAQLRTGVELVHRQLTNAFEKFGVKAIAAVSCQFDPSCHEAVLRVEDPGQPDGLVIEELQKGYEAGGKAIRPSMVKVVSNS